MIKIDQENGIKLNTKEMEAKLKTSFSIIKPFIDFNHGTAIEMAKKLLENIKITQEDKIKLDKIIYLIDHDS